VAELEDFERVFGPLRILNKKEDLFMDVTRKIKAVGMKMKDVKNKNTGEIENKPWWYIWDFQEQWPYSTFDAKVGERIDELKTGDTAKIQYEVQNNFKNITAVERVIQVNEEIQEEKIPPRLAQSLEERIPAFSDEKTKDIHRQVAWKIAGSAYGWFDLDGRSQEERQKLLAGLASTIEEILNQ